METQGGVGGAAKRFLVEVEKKKKQRANELTNASSSIANIDLMTSLSIELQRLNSEMILQRLSRDRALIVSDLTRLESAKREAVRLAREGLNANEEWKENEFQGGETKSKQEENHGNQELHSLWTPPKTVFEEREQHQSTDSTKISSQNRARHRLENLAILEAEAETAGLPIVSAKEKQNIPRPSNESTNASQQPKTLPLYVKKNSSMLSRNRFTQKAGGLHPQPETEWKDVCYQEQQILSTPEETPIIQELEKLRSPVAAVSQKCKWNQNSWTTKLSL